jgi:hypothetical protein
MFAHFLGCENILTISFYPMLWYDHAYLILITWYDTGCKVNNCKYKIGWDNET